MSPFLRGFKMPEKLRVTNTAEYGMTVNWTFGLDGIGTVGHLIFDKEAPVA